MELLDYTYLLRFCSHDLIIIPPKRDRMNEKVILQGFWKHKTSPNALNSHLFLSFLFHIFSLHWRYVPYKQKRLHLLISILSFTVDYLLECKIRLRLRFLIKTWGRISDGFLERENVDGGLRRRGLNKLVVKLGYKILNMNGEFCIRNKPFSETKRSWREHM